MVTCKVTPSTIPANVKTPVAVRWKESAGMVRARGPPASDCFGARVDAIAAITQDEGGLQGKRIIAPLGTDRESGLCRQGGEGDTLALASAAGIIDGLDLSGGEGAVVEAGFINEPLNIRRGPASGHADYDRY